MRELQGPIHHNWKKLQLWENLNVVEKLQPPKEKTLKKSCCTAVRDCVASELYHLPPTIGQIFGRGENGSMNTQCRSLVPGEVLLTLFSAHSE